LKFFFFDKNKIDKVTVYTDVLLKHLAKINGHECVDNPGDADVLAISMTSLYEIGNLIRLRKQNPNGVIIAGGHVCANASAILRFADYVCMGQGFEFFEQCKSVSDLNSMSYIVSKNKTDGKFSQYINWDVLPVAQISKKAWSYLYGIGCRNRCKFCLTSHINKYQTHPNKAVFDRLREKIKGQLYLISNDYDKTINIKRNTADITVKEYLSDPNGYSHIQFIYLGIEGVAGESRKLFGKNVTTEMIKEMFGITGKLRQRTKLFFIAGVDSQEAWEAFAEYLPITYDSEPSMGIIVNYFSPQAYTPLGNYDLRQMKMINLPRIKRIWKIKSARVKIFKDLALAPYSAIFDCMLGHANWDEVDKVLSFRKENKFLSGGLTMRKFTPMEEVFDKIDRAGLTHLISGRSENYIKAEIQ
jgi:radical SAM superfamily enzyme YgiQ (UPF0313 family)